MFGSEREGKHGTKGEEARSEEYGEDVSCGGGFFFF